jgi:hypothetical protein
MDFLIELIKKMVIIFVIMMVVGLSIGFVANHTMFACYEHVEDDGYVVKSALDIFYKKIQPCSSFNYEEIQFVGFDFK